MLSGVLHILVKLLPELGVPCVLLPLRIQGVSFSSRSRASVSGPSFPKVRVSKDLHPILPPLYHCTLRVFCGSIEILGRYYLDDQLGSLQSSSAF